MFLVIFATKNNRFDKVLSDREIPWQFLSLFQSVRAHRYFSI